MCKRRYEFHVVQHAKTLAQCKTGGRRGHSHTRLTHKSHIRAGAEHWLQYANRVHSNLTEQVAECVREQFPRLITFNANCSDFAVAAPLATEMARAAANRV